MLKIRVEPDSIASLIRFGGFSPLHGFAAAEAFILDGSGFRVLPKDYQEYNAPSDGVEMLE